jgi:hypothetical protein
LWHLPQGSSAGRGFLIDLYVYSRCVYSKAR